MSDDTQNSYVDLFAETPDVADEPSNEPVETTEDESVPEVTPENQEATEEPQDDKPTYVAKIDIDGKEFELDEPKIQHLAEQYVEVVAQNKELTKHREVVEQAMGYIDSIRKGQDIDEAMKALGVDFDKLIMDRVKDFIRRSTLSQKERELEDARKENERLKKDREERERIEYTKREQEEGRKNAEEIMTSVNLALAKVPENLKTEVQVELLTQIERKIRSGGVRPSARAIANAASIIAERKQKSLQVETKQVKVLPKPVKNSPTPASTQTSTSRYNAEDYTKLFT
jgi:hypothetical protein